MFFQAVSKHIGLQLYRRDNKGIVEKQKKGRKLICVWMTNDQFLQWKSEAEG